MTTNFIATRELRDDAGNVAVVVSIAEPLAVPNAPEGVPGWAGLVRIATDGGTPQDIGVMGNDAVQVLQGSLEAARVLVEKLGRSLSAFEGFPGETGFPRPIASGYGRDVYERLVRAHDAELERVFDERAASDPAYAARRAQARGATP